MSALILGRTDHKYLGYEFDWLAIDKHQNLGFFASSGEGWVPECVLESSSLFENTVELVISWPAKSQTMLLSKAKADYFEWIEVARRGIYAFDWNCMTERYELLVAPEAPLCLEDLADIRNDQLRKLFRLTSLDCRFDSEIDFPLYTDY